MPSLYVFSFYLLLSVGGTLATLQTLKWVTRRLELYLEYRSDRIEERLREVRELFKTKRTDPSPSPSKEELEIAQIRRSRDERNKEADRLLAERRKSSEAREQELDRLVAEAQKAMKKE